MQLYWHACIVYPYLISLVTTIFDSHMIISQIQDSANYLKDACDRLEAIKETQKGLQADKTMKKRPTEIRKALEELLTCLRSAESVLVLPQPTSALQIYNAEQKVVIHTMHT